MKVWYFEIYSIIDWTYEEKKKIFAEFVYNVLKKILEKYCRQNKINKDKFLSYHILKNLTVDELIKKVWELIANSIVYAMLKFYIYTKELFNETFESKWYYYVLKDKNFIFNEEKLKLFKEYKISQAERYLKNSIKKFIWNIIREKLYWIKIKEEDNKIDYWKESNKNQVNDVWEEIYNQLWEELNDKEWLDEDDYWLEDNNDWNEDDMWVSKMRKWLDKQLERIKELKEKWWLKNELLAKLEYEIYKLRKTTFEDFMKAKKS